MRPRPPAPPRLSHDEFACLVDRHQQRLHAYLAGLVGPGEQAFDLVQETFYEAWCATRTGTQPFLPGADDSQVLRWLLRAGSNNALSQLRRRRLIRWESLDVLPEPLVEGDGFEDRVVETDALNIALATLAPQDVACLLLRVVNGFSAAETGHILGVSPANVDTRLARAKQRLRAAYVEHTRGPRNHREVRTQP
jgi:RNA polymerase sigma-70 factor (ECF subfamily)